MGIHFIRFIAGIGGIVSFVSRGAAFHGELTSRWQHPRPTANRWHHAPPGAWLGQISAISSKECNFILRFSRERCLYRRRERSSRLTSPGRPWMEYRWPPYTYWWFTINYGDNHTQSWMVGGTGGLGVSHT